MKLKSQFKKSPNQSSSKYLELTAGIVALVSAGIVFFFFMETKGTPSDPNKIYIFVKQEYSSWAWGIFSLSSMLYYFIRSNKTKTSSGYMNPILKWMLDLLKMIPFLGLVLSLIYGNDFVIKNNLWNNILSISNNLLDTILIFFVMAYLVSGIGDIRSFFRKNQ